MYNRTGQLVVLNGLFVALTVSFQMLGFPQLVTGPVVNSMLLLAALFGGPTSGILVGVLTPWIAGARGILPPPLLPMIPFIMLGNSAYVVTFYLCRKAFHKGAGTVVGGIAGAIAKYLILSAAVRFIVQVPGPVAQAMQIPQLITALIGVGVAVSVARVLQTAGREEVF